VCVCVCVVVVLLCCVLFFERLKKVVVVERERLMMKSFCSSKGIVVIKIVCSFAPHNCVLTSLLIYATHRSCCCYSSYILLRYSQLITVITADGHALRQEHN
jgi:hypothetical protein